MPKFIKFSKCEACGKEVALREEASSGKVYYFCGNTTEKHERCTRRVVFSIEESRQIKENILKEKAEDAKKPPVAAVKEDKPPQAPAEQPDARPGTEDEAGANEDIDDIEVLLNG
ncbi:MAG: hypothetical protein K8953_05215 [Proteobacteria bacterium]|nr:hypothetical protein [Pseudomonadota bacterium]